MSILVTGGAGYIGSHVVHMLCDAGEDVVVIDNLVTGFQSALPEAAAFYQGNVGDALLLRRIFKRHAIEAVMHFAGSTVVPESVANPMKYYQNNTANSAVLIAECIKAKVKRFIFSSTAAVYGSSDGTPIDENIPLDPLSPYASSKLMTEEMLRDAAESSPLNYVVLRYFNVAGADSQGRTGQSSANATHLIKVACQTALGERSHLDIYGDDYPTEDGTCIRDYIHVTDLADAHILALKHLQTTDTSLTLNCGYGHGVSVKEVIDVVNEVCGRPLPVQIAGRRPGDPSAIVADSTALKDILDWQPQYDDLHVIVSSAMGWEKQCLQKKAG